MRHLAIISCPLKLFLGITFSFFFSFSNCILGEAQKGCKSPVTYIWQDQPDSKNFCHNITDPFDNREALCDGLNDLHSKYCDKFPNDTNYQKDIETYFQTSKPFSFSSLSGLCDEWNKRTFDQNMSQFLSPVFDIFKNCSKICFNIKQPFNTLCSQLFNATLVYQYIHQNHPSIHPGKPMKSNPEKSPEKTNNKQGKDSGVESSAGSATLKLENAVEADQSLKNDNNAVTASSINTKASENMSTVDHNSKSDGSDLTLESKKKNETPESNTNRSDTSKYSSKANLTSDNSSKTSNSSANKISNQENAQDTKGNVGVASNNNRTEDKGSNNTVRNGQPTGNSNETPDQHGGSGVSELMERTPDDSNTFMWFMLVCTAFIIGYVAHVNKKKLIALVLEGRRDSHRRRYPSASYSKLDSNLEEALSSNRTVSSHQALY